MMAFGKQCPTCGAKRLVARPADSRLVALPFVQALACAACGQQIRKIFFVAIGVEHRRFPRKQLPAHFLIRLHGSTEQYARVSNISIGGLCFAQQYNAAPVNDHRFTLDLYNCNDGSSLEQLQVELVKTSEQIVETNGVKTTVLNNRARFVNLNAAQQKVLSACLHQFGH